jgi:streptomycin 6-kinase
MEWLSGSAITHDCMASATRRAVALYSAGHVDAGQLDLIPVSEYLRDRLSQADQALSELGRDARLSLASRLQSLEAQRQTTIHGDAVGMNVLTRSEGLALIDPAGVSGPPEFDAARWIVRSVAIEDPDNLPELIQQALAADADLDSAALEICVGIALVLEAHQRNKNKPMFLALGAPASDFGDRTARMVQAARCRLLT